MQLKATGKNKLRFCALLPVLLFFPLLATAQSTQKWTLESTLERMDAAYMELYRKPREKR